MAFFCVYGFMAITMDSARLLVIGGTMYYLVMLAIFVFGPICILEKVRVFFKLVILQSHQDLDPRAYSIIFSFY